MEYDVSLDGDRTQLDVVHRLLASAYWSQDIRRDVLESAFRNSLVAGAFEGESGLQVAVARAVTDYATFAWLCDVFVEAPHRGRGLSKRMVAR